MSTASPAPGPQLSVTPNASVPLRIVLADPAFLVVYKPAGVVTQPGEGHEHDTLLNGLFATHGTTLQNLGRARDFGLVHRLDRVTSGLVVVALTLEAYAHLRAQFAARRVKKTYLTLVHGAPRPPEGTDRTPLREVREQGRKVALLGEHPRAQLAVTRYKILVRARGLTLVECQPETGRLHQIRAHLAHRGCPVVGERDYGRQVVKWDAHDSAFQARAGRALFLHAAVLSFCHPTTGGTQRCFEPLPPAWVEFLGEVGIGCPRIWRGER